MPTLLLSPPFNEDSQSVWEAALETGWNVEQVRGWQVPEGLDTAGLAYYGFLRPPFARMLAHSLSLVLLEPTVEWLPKLPTPYRARNVHLTTLADARTSRGPAFIKPAEDKHFPAGVYDNGSSLPRDESLSDSLPVLVAEPVTWEVEYRCFVLKREVVTLSPYWRHGRLVEDEGDDPWRSATSERTSLLEWARTLLDDPAVALPPAVVIDIGFIEGRGWAVVEANPAWASGLYGCDPARVLPVVQRACVPLSGLTEEERRWVGDSSGEVVMGHTL
ncbi:MAG: ATP-grasp domain-containing protein [Armatimonadota bacterium]|nr:ATP-grasp domain-containing protein [Armatimonadota bacterium]